ncbi:MAG: hypothetical protein AB7F87_11780 [Oligoflexales bacterium]
MAQTKNQTASASCQLVGQTETTDPIAKVASSGCNMNVEKMFYDAGCKSFARTRIAEKTFATNARTIDIFTCPPNPETKIFFSHPDELLVLTEDTKVINYYKYENGNLNFKGNSFSPNNPCRKCHVMGGMVMKELEMPWENWLDGNPDGPNQPTQLELLGKDLNGVQRRLFDKESMEIAVRGAAQAVAKSYKEGIRKGNQDLASLTLRDVLKPFLCTVEVNLVTDQMPNLTSSDDHTPFGIANLYQAPSGVFSGNIPRAPGPGIAKITEYYATHNISNGNYFTIVPKLGGTQKAYVTALSTAETAEDSTLVDTAVSSAALHFDMQNPVFSKRRCGLLNLVPQTPMVEFKNARSSRDQLIEVFSASSEPDAKAFAKLVQEYSNLHDPMASIMKMVEQSKAIGEACSKPEAAIQDVDKVYRLYRSKLIPLLQKKPLKYFDRINVVEHFPDIQNSPSKMFPEYQEIIDGKYAAEEGLGLNEKCELVQY